MPVPISMPVPCQENIIPSGAKFNYLMVYVASGAALDDLKKTNAVGNQLSSPTRSREIF
jgi:hypothetical protein